MRYLKMKLKTLDSNQAFVDISNEPIKTMSETEMKQDMCDLLLSYDCKPSVDDERSKILLKGLAGIVYVKIE